MKIIEVQLKNPGPTMRIQPDLAEEIGFDEHIVFLQLEWLIKTYGVEREGEAWLRVPVRGLRARYARWWSVAKLNGLLNRLEQIGLIRSASFGATSGDTAKSYALDTTGLRRLRSVTFVETDIDPKASGFNVFTPNRTPRSGSEHGRSEREHGRSGSEHLHGDHEERDHEESSSTRAREVEATAPPVTDDDDDLDQVLRHFEDLTGRTRTDDDRVAAREMLDAAPLEVIIAEMTEVRRRARKPIHSLRYFVRHVLTHAAALAHAGETVPDRKRPAGAAAPPARETTSAGRATSGALALAPTVEVSEIPVEARHPNPDHPVARFQGGYSDEYLGRLAEAAYRFRHELRAELGRAPSTREIRNRLLPWAAETGYDIAAVERFYGAPAHNDAHHPEHEAEPDRRSGEAARIEVSTPSIAADSSQSASPGVGTDDGPVPAIAGDGLGWTGAERGGGSGDTGAPFNGLSDRRHRSGPRAVPRRERRAPGGAAASSVAPSPFDESPEDQSRRRGLAEQCKRLREPDRRGKEARHVGNAAAGDRSPP